jgi:hypothetical protein
MVGRVTPTILAMDAFETCFCRRRRISSSLPSSRDAGAKDGLAPQGAFYLRDDGALRCGAGDRAPGGRIHVAGGAIDRGGASGILMPNEN